MARSRCPHCSQHIEFPDEMEGQETACPTCGRKTNLVAEPNDRVAIPKQNNTAMPRSNDSAVASTARRIVDNVERVIIGKRPEITLAIVGYLAEGHLLLEDVPGVAKTMLARAIAQTVGCTFKRIQCTPDLLPNDITGASI